MPDPLLEPLPSVRWVERAEQARSLLDPLRSAILEHLREPGSSTSVAEALGLPRQRVNYHVRALEEEGLVAHVENRRKGNCVERLVRATARRYVVDPEVFGAGDREDQVGAGARHDPYSSEGLIEGAMITLRQVAELEERAAGERLPALSLELPIRFRGPREEVEFANALREALELLRDRYHDPAARDGRTFRVAVAGHLDPAQLPAHD